MPRGITTGNDYQTKLVKLIPAEFVAAYLTIDNIVPAGPLREWLLSFAVVVLLLALPSYLRRISKVQGVAQILVTCGSFLVWIYSLGGPFNEWDLFIKPLAGVILILWTTLLPLFNFECE